jgi:hypothetical protein
MNIAILGWGSLVPDPRGLPIADGWHQGGPVLPIEFSRISKDGQRAGCLTLVIDEVQGSEVPTHYAVSTRTELAQAITDLQEVEGTPNRENIGFCNIATRQDSPRARLKHPNALARIRDWAEKNGFHAVVWTALGPRFKDGSPGVPFTPAAALDYLNGLPPATKELALQYIRTAPPQTMTAFRRLLLAQTNREPPAPDNPA